MPRPLLALLLVACRDEEKPAASGDPTWHQDVAPIVARSCAGCHAEGGLAPFSLDSYAASAPFAEAIASSAESGLMPPWGAQETEDCAPRLPFQDDLRLSAEDIATLRAWADAGAPEGDSGDAAELPAPADLSLADATHDLAVPAPYTTGGDEDQFICFSLDPGLEQDAWVTGVAVEPGDETVVHHALIFADSQRQSEALAGEEGWFPCSAGGIVGDALLGGWAPGAAPFVTPDDVGMPLAAGSLVVLQIHYHPTGVDKTDQSTVNLRITADAPAYQAEMALIGNFDRAGLPSQGRLLEGPNDEGGVEFRIPAGASGHTETMEYQVTGLGDRVIKVFSAGTHMHLVGTDMSFEVRHDEPVGSEPEEECLVQTPRWDFNWQRGYSYDAALADLPELRDRDTLVMRCVYDNVPENPGVQQLMRDEGLDGPVDVYLGEETTDEMCLGVAGIVYYSGF